MAAPDLQRREASVWLEQYWEASGLRNSNAPSPATTRRPPAARSLEMTTGQGDEAGHNLRAGKGKRTVEEQTAKEQKRAALGDISNKALQRCEQGISKLDVHTKGGEPGNAAPGNIRLTRQTARQMQSTRAAAELAEPMSVEKQHSDNDLPDVDACDTDDTQLCTMYVREIYDHLAEVEKQHRVMVHYMSVQKDINATMRGILIDWLVEVAEEYGLVTETLYLAVNYIDRFLQCVPVHRGKLQLVGVTCMLIAAKYEEIKPPVVDEFVYISDNTYTRDEILRMEAGILDKLGFQLTVATPKVFLKRFFRVANHCGLANHTTNVLSQYLCELTLQDYAFLKYVPSTIAASCLWLSMLATTGWSWDRTLVHYTRYTESHLARCVKQLWQVWRDAPSSSLMAVQEKYGTSRFMNVSAMKPPDALPELD